jgi:ElaB/YqjD/DUF883 family membrane-anchored ribosome-binding protein
MSTTQNPIAGMNTETTHHETGGVQRVKDTATQFGHKAAETIDRNIDNAAGALERSANALRSRVTEQDSRLNDFASTAAEKLDATARYFRQNHTQEMMTGVERGVRRNPAVSLAAAAAGGFLIGMTMRRDRH